MDKSCIGRPKKTRNYSDEMDVAQARDKRINPYNDLLKDRQPQWYVER